MMIVGDWHEEDEDEDDDDEDDQEIGINYNIAYRQPKDQSTPAHRQESEKALGGTQPEIVQKQYQHQEGGDSRTKGADDGESTRQFQSSSLGQS